MLLETLDLEVVVRCWEEEENISVAFTCPWIALLGKATVSFLLSAASKVEETLRPSQRVPQGSRQLHQSPRLAIQCCVNTYRQGQRRGESLKNMVTHRNHLSSDLNS